MTKKQFVPLILLVSVFLIFFSILYFLRHDSQIKLESEDIALLPILQTPPGKCGPRSLFAICELLGVETTLDKLCQLSSYSEESPNTTMKGLYQASVETGLDAKGMKVSLDQLCRMNQPVIAFVSGNHFLVVERCVGDLLRILDPPKIYLLRKTQFAKIWDRNILVISRLDSKKPDTKVPDIRAAEQIHDLGRISQGDDAVYRFRFRNHGDATLVVSGIKSSCSCTANILTAKEMPPGGEGQLEVKVLTSSKLGWINESVILRCNDPYKPVVYFTLAGTIKASATVMPKRLYFSESNGTPAWKNIKVLEPGNEKLRVKRVEATSQYIRTEIIPLPREQEEVATQIRVTLIPGLPLGNFREALTIYTNSSERPKLIVPIEGKILGNVTVFPDQLFFGIVSKGQSISRQVMITNAGNKPLKILGVKTNSDLTEADFIPIEEGKKYKVAVRLNTKTHIGPIEDMIRISTDSDQQPVLNIPLYGLVQK